MEFRHLGKSGLKVSAVSYGNWITHGSQLEAEQATACVRAALDAGITTETMAGIDSVLSSVIETDRAMVGLTSPKQRLR
jgi:predicted oxidoreductase